MGNYPKELIDDYRGGKINRARFIQLFKQWQINNTIDYSCKGTADRNGSKITYRGITGKIENGVICWGKHNTAETLFIFERQIDYAFNQEHIAFKNACYYSGEANEATLHADYEKRAYCIKARDEFLKQAEKWGALWT